MILVHETNRHGSFNLNKDGALVETCDSIIARISGLTGFKSEAIQLDPDNVQYKEVVGKYAQVYQFAEEAEFFVCGKLFEIDLEQGTWDRTTATSSTFQPRNTEKKDS